MWEKKSNSSVLSLVARAGKTQPSATCNPIKSPGTEWMGTIIVSTWWGNEKDRMVQGAVFRGGSEEVSMGRNRLTLEEPVSHPSLRWWLSLGYCQRPGLGLRPWSSHEGGLCWCLWLLSPLRTMKRPVDESWPQGPWVRELALPLTSRSTQENWPWTLPGQHTKADPVVGGRRGAGESALRVPE